MALLIDGYNLLFAAGFSDPSPTAPRLAHARLALLDFVASSVDPAERPRTTVVFDAAQAPCNLPRELLHREMLVRFAVGYASADELLEELIRRDSAPRRLVVVSSDHRVQRAARRRRATAIDSGEWYARAIARRAAFSPTSRRRHTGRDVGTPAAQGEKLPRRRTRTPPHGRPQSASPEGPAAAKPGSMPPSPGLSEGEVAFWLRQFTEGENAIDPALLRELQGIFPPGYAEDVFRDEG